MNINVKYGHMNVKYLFNECVITLNNLNIYIISPHSFFYIYIIYKNPLTP